MKLDIYFHLGKIKVGNYFYQSSFTSNMEHLIILVTSQRYKIMLTPRMFPVWDFVVGIFTRKAMFNMG